jgi:gluconolactonase
MPIEQVAPDLERIVSVNEEIKELGKGFGGEQGPAEGPLWWQEEGCLLFSDIHNNCRMKWSHQGGMTVAHAPTNRSNGLTRDLQGRLIACEHDSRRVTRTEPDGSITVVANSFQGRQLNRPNDVVVKSDASIYFTDPWTHRRPREEWELTFSGVFRVSPDLGTLTLLVSDFVLSNGLAFSPDESVLYINDSRRGHIRAFDVQDDGTLSLASDRVFCELRGDRPGVPDGMKVDVEGNVYCGGSGGLWIIDSSGKHLGTIVHGSPATTNLAFGGEDWRTLFFTTRTSVGSVQCKIPGVSVPVAR